VKFWNELAVRVNKIIKKSKCKIKIEDELNEKSTEVRSMRFYSKVKAEIIEESNSQWPRDNKRRRRSAKHCMESDVKGESTRRIKVKAKVDLEKKNILWKIFNVGNTAKTFSNFFSTKFLWKIFLQRVSSG